MSGNRFQELLNFSKKSNSPIFSIKDFGRLRKELRNIERSESSPPNIKELNMLVLIENSLLVSLCNYIFRTVLYQTSLSNEELESFEEFEKNILSDTISYYKNSIVELEKHDFFNDNELREEIKERKNLMSTTFEEAKSELVKLIQREKIRLQNIPNNHNLGDEIVRVYKQINDTETKDLERVWRLFSELKKKLESGEKNKNDSGLFTATFILVIDKCKEFFDKWKKTVINPTDEELGNAKKVVKAVLDNVAKFSLEDLPPNINNFPGNYFSEAERELKAFEEKLKEKIPYQPDENFSLDEQINNLKSQIKTLEGKINNIPDDNDSNKQRYEGLIRQLKAQLKEKEKEKESQQQNKNDFSWKWYVGIAGLTIIILLFILLIKKITKS